jgi:hypothetical protein
MLKLMRKHATSWMIKVLLWGIIIVFVGYFGYGSLSEKEHSVAQIGPYKVGPREYREAYNKTLEVYKMIFKEKLDEKMKKELKIEEKAMDGIVNTYILLVVAKELGITVSDGEFGDFLNSVEVFKRDGKFNKEQYLAALRREKLEPEEFEKSQKRNILVRKVASVVQDTGTFFNEPDVWAGYVKEKGKVNLAYTLFDPSAFRDKMNISEKELLDLYEREKGVYKAENTYRFKLLVVDEKSSLKDDVVYMDLLKAKDIDAYGKEKGLAISDLGDMKESDLIKQFKGLKREDLKDMKKKGEISRVVRSPEGKSYIFQLVDMTEGKDLDKTLALAKVREKLIGEKAKVMAKLAAEGAIKDKSLSAKNETGFITRSSNKIEGLGEIPQESRGILSLSQTKTLHESAIEISGKYYVFSYKDEQLPDKQEWAKDKESYTKYFVGKNSEEFLNSFLTEMKTKIKVTIDQKAL